MYTLQIAKALPDGETEVGVKQLRADLSAWLQRVREGTPVIVTDRGRPVARLIPIDAPTGLERLIAEGRVRLPLAPKRPGSPKGIPVKGSVSDLVAEHRR